MDNKYDKLEQYFRNTILKDDTDTPIPSEELFSNAMEVVNSKKKKRRFFLLPYLISLCIILSLLLYKSQLEIIKLRDQKVNSVALHEDKKSQILSPSNNQSKTLSETKISGSNVEILNPNEVSNNKIFKAIFIAEKEIFMKNEILNNDSDKIIENTGKQVGSS